MQRTLHTARILTFVLLLGVARHGDAQKPVPAKAGSKVPQVKASAAILVDAMTGQVLFAKNPDLRRPPASTTKIMTAILLLENTEPSDLIRASKKAFETEGSSLNLQLGEQITAQDMLYALMLRSANDGCVAVAEHVAGSEARFAQLMTARAHEVGATSTEFKNANGLNCAGHLTTARDLATMARYAQHFPEFSEATRTKFYTIARSTASKDIVLKNHAKFLWKYAGADGIKTGYTNPAGKCFVGGATRNGWRLISVVLNSPDVVEETTRLMNYGFNMFEAVPVASKGEVYAKVPVEGGDEPEVPVAAQDEVHVVQAKGQQAKVELKTKFEAVKAPVPLGAPVGTLEAWADGKLVATTPLVSTVDVHKATVLAVGGMGSGRYLVLALVGTVVIGYGTAFAKTARRRGYRLSAILRSSDRGG
jgi:serine-type D-Ala-D-Ala carboxypeptidase (penicillin-binding protein 5/6)